MPKPDRYICIHGHFYQPPRENAWLETVETQDSAAPYHDWNERITAECYATNGASRIVNAKNEIIRILNNYARISFNFGPTLLSWLEENAPRTYRMILDADQRSQQRYGGHGSAMAQVYNHIIMPLANTRDRITQIRWGIADFEHRFGRKPEGMWLSETAVDTESLELLAEHGIRYTVLAPNQCARVRSLTHSSTKGSDGIFSEGGPPWQETPNASVDTTHPYFIRLRKGRKIAVFFYDGPRSRAIAFEGLLNSGEAFATRLNSGFRDDRKEAQLVHVATDGESYGHHHRFGEMALSYAVKLIEKQGTARLTNYGEFLEKFPPTFEAQIVEDTSWSCAHGVERWRSNCGCNSGRAGWNQRWRTPLRDALDGLRDAIAPLTEATAAGLYKDAWAARDAYIQVVLDRATVDQFFAEQASHVLSGEERVRALKLMEMQRHAQLMYTSCGWFFDEISGIETVQVIAYACRVLQLATELFGEAAASLEASFIQRLRAAESKVPEKEKRTEIYLKLARLER
jgi:alpha-amylase/alpha-mannosidase (GH57 family)